MTPAKTPARVVPIENLDFVPRFAHGEVARLAAVSGSVDALIAYEVHPADRRDPAS